MRKARIVIMTISAIILVVFIVIIDYSDIMAKQNLGYLLGILSAAFNILAMILSNRHERREAIRKGEKMS